MRGSSLFVGRFKMAPLRSAILSGKLFLFWSSGMPAGIPLDHFHRWGCDGKRLLHGISIDCNKKVSGFARGSSAVPLGEGKASSPSQSNPSDLPAPPKGGASDASARLAFYLETAPLLQKAPPSGELANECEPERVQHAESKRKSLFHSAALSQKAAL